CRLAARSREAACRGQDGGGWRRSLRAGANQEPLALAHAAQNGRREAAEPSIALPAGAIRRTAEGRIAGNRGPGPRVTALTVWRAGWAPLEANLPCGDV